MRVPKLYCGGLARFLLFTVAVLAFPGNVLAQQIVVHDRSASSEDGDPERDADGSANGRLVWRGGAVHVVPRVFDTDGRALIIAPGAIVKFARGPAGLSGGVAPDDDPPLLQIEGAVLTWLADHEEGGNTIEALAAMGIDFGSGIVPWDIYGFGNRASYIRNSKLKNRGRILGLGWMEIVENEFIDFRSIRAPYTSAGGSGSPGLVYEATVDAEPLILNNSIKYTGGNDFSPQAVLDMRGARPTIMGNRIESSRDAVLIGWARSDLAGRISPTSGTTLVHGNTFADTQLRMHGSNFTDYDAVFGAPFSADVSNNTFEGASGLELDVYTNTAVTSNEFTGTGTAISLHTIENAAGSGQATEPFPFFRINDNTFASSYDFGIRFLFANTDPASFYAQLLEKEAFVSAKNNDWGHPSGPNDPSDRDGLSNDGAGLGVQDLIDYNPWVGGAFDTDLRGELTVTTDPDPPFYAFSSVTFQATVDFSLNMGRGRVELEIRTRSGELLTRQGPVDIAAGTGSVDFTDVQLEIPEDIRAVVVQAILYPTAGSGVYTNAESFSVQFQTTTLKVSSAVVTPPESESGIVPGSSVGLEVTVDHSFSAAPGQSGTLDITVFESSATPPRVVQTVFATESVAVEPGSQTFEEVYQLGVPLRAFFVSETEILVSGRLTTDTGRQVEDQSRAIPVLKQANRVTITSLGVVDTGGEQRFARPVPYLMPGEIDFYVAMQGAYAIGTPSSSGWRVEGEIVFLDGVGNVLAAIPMIRNDTGGPVLQDLATGSETTTGVISVGPTDPVPSHAAEARITWQLITNGGLAVSESRRVIPVRQPLQVSSQPVPAGGGTVDLNPLPISGEVSGNAAAGNLKGIEFSGPFTTSGSAVTKRSSAPALIQLNRYWDLFTDLDPGSYTAELSFQYTPEIDFPEGESVSEDSLAIAIFDSTTQTLVALATGIDPANNILTVTVDALNTTFVPVLLRETVTDVAPPTEPARFQLAQNYPNPFNPETRIAFELSEPLRVRLEIYNLLGQKVRTLLDAKKVTGVHSVLWNGRSDSGDVVASGVYVYRVEAGDFAQSKKLLLLR